MSKRLLTLYNVAGYVFLLAPLAIVLVLSFSAGATVAFPPPGFSLRWFRYLAGRDEFISSALVSLEIAALASLGAVVLGLPASLALVRERFPGKAFIEGVLMSPLVLPGIITGIALLQYFTAIGLIRSFPRLVLAHLVICTPYAIRSITRVSASHRSIHRGGLSHARRECADDISTRAAAAPATGNRRGIHLLVRHLVRQRRRIDLPDRRRHGDAADSHPDVC